MNSSQPVQETHSELQAQLIDVLERQVKALEERIVELTESLGEAMALADEFGARLDQIANRSTE